MAPLGGLGAIYLRLSRQGGPMLPKFPAPGEFLSVSGWVGRLGWVDPISVAIKDGLPFTDREGPLYEVFSPAVWLAIAGVLGLATAWRRGTSDRRTRERRAWQTLAAILVMGGVFGPDSLGPGHGDYLPQRLTLLGLVALVPTFQQAPKSWTQRAAAWAIAVALVLQTVVVWDYALDSQEKVAQVVAIGPSVGRGQRVATLLTNLKTRFRPNAVLHADSWLGISEGAVLWSNYETRHYYFPVQFRPELARPDSFEMEQIALRSGSANAEERWARMLETYHDAIDRVVVWRDDPGLDAITERWFELVVRRGDVRVFRRREGR
jgi:predicted small integral membrane protein